MTTEKKEASPEQLRLAKMYRIPKSQAHTINLEKAKAYRAWARGPGNVELYLDKQGAR